VRQLHELVQELQPLVLQELGLVSLQVAQASQELLQQCEQLVVILELQAARVRVQLV
jgi:hypothetical protein